MSQDDDRDSLFKDPNEESIQLGDLEILIHLKCPDGYDSTCGAMENIAKAETRADRFYHDRIDDYTIPLFQTLCALDTFIKEHSQGKSKGGTKSAYKVHHGNEVTLFILWQIRNIFAHGGGIVDEKCRNAYSRAISLRAGIKDEMPIDLPESLDVGTKMTVRRELFYQVKECLLSYIGERMSEEDTKILRTRSNITDVRIDEVMVPIPLPFGTILVDIKRAIEMGAHLDAERRRFSFPTECYYDEKQQSIVFPDGQQLPAKRVSAENRLPHQG